MMRAGSLTFCGVVLRFMVLGLYFKVLDLYLTSWMSIWFLGRAQTYSLGSSTSWTYSGVLDVYFGVLCCISGPCAWTGNLLHFLYSHAIFSCLNFFEKSLIIIQA